MSETDAQTELKRCVLSRRLRWWLFGFLTVSLVLLAVAFLTLRPTARLNRLFGSVGLTRLPSSTRNVQIGKRGRFLGTQTIYIRFEADANDAARFVNDCPMTIDNEPVPLANISFGPRCPAWMTWEATVAGRMYHGSPVNTSVWLAIDDDAHTVYVGVFEFRPPWLRKLLD